MNVKLNYANLRRARLNAGYSTREATRAVCKGTKRDRVAEWERGDTKPTHKQLKKLAEEYQISPFFFAVAENLPRHRRMPDYREKTEPQSLNLRRFINFLYLRQLYCAMMLKEHKAKKISFSQASKINDAESWAEVIRQQLQYAFAPVTTTSHLEYLSERIEAQGIFVMKTLPYWPIEVAEMHGLYLKNAFAPIIALNREATTAMQLFTLAHELAHAFMSKEGLSCANFNNTSNADEVFCQQIAVNLLLPQEHFVKKHYTLADIQSIAKNYQVSEAVVLYRLHGLHKILANDLTCYQQTIARSERTAMRQQQCKRTRSRTLANMEVANGKLFIDFVVSLYHEDSINCLEATNLLQIPIDRVERR